MSRRTDCLSIPDVVAKLRHQTFHLFPTQQMDDTQKNKGSMTTGWQLTEVDEPYRKAAAAARTPAAAAALKHPAVAEGLTGGDPGALTHHTEATEPQAAAPSESEHNILPQKVPRSDQSTTTSSSNSSSGATPRGAVTSAWLWVIGLVGSLVSKLMYALNSVLSSMEIPEWALKGVSALAMGPMQKKLLQLYAEAGDHSRRLSSVAANGKFSSIQAGPDEPWEVSASAGLPTVLAEATAPNLTIQG